MSHHHHHHKHKSQSSSSRSQPENQNSGGLNLSSALQNLNLPSLASNLLGNMDLGQLIGILSGIASNPLKNTVSTQQFTSPILKDKPSTKENEIAQDIPIENLDDKPIEFKTPNKSQPDKETLSAKEAAALSESIESLKFDPDKLSGMLNNLVNMLNSQQTDNVQ